MILSVILSKQGYNSAWVIVTLYQSEQTNEQTKGHIVYG